MHRSGIENIKEKFKEIFIILSPPRCSSTALARVFWEHPSIGYYSHEPFEKTFHHKTTLEDALHFLDNPIQIKTPGESYLVKEMVFQVHQHFRELVKFTKNPLTFLIRDPRLSLYSRIEKFEAGKKDPVFPYVEAGWKELKLQLNTARDAEIPFSIVDATEFRNHPLEILPTLFERLNLSFSPEMICWQPRPDLDLCNLGGEHHHLYERVLKSSGLQPANENIPDISAFPLKLQPIVETCLNIYQEIKDDPERIHSPGN